MHLKHPDLSPTAGCIGLNKAVLWRMILTLTPQTPLYFGREATLAYERKN
jgi:L,D-peptidoglycan transpeptidase YkuD (ErfK/YbiS/YcfS/YnhG family)